MGLMRFLLPQPTRFTNDAAQRAYFAGVEQIPWRARLRLDQDTLILERDVADSGNLYVPWIVDGYGELVLGTASLMERAEPYRLAVELARGKVSQLRNQFSDWRTIGLEAPPAVEAEVRRAIQLFSVAATCQHDPAAADAQAEQAIHQAVVAGEQLVDCYIEQALEVRRRQSRPLPTLLAANVGHAPLAKRAAAGFLDAFNAAVVPFVWRRVEAAEAKYDWKPYDRLVDWCVAQQRKVIGGPLVRLDDHGLPDWLCLWEDDVDSLMAFVRDYVETVVNRYRGRVDYWQCAARVNAGKALALGEEAKLRLAVSAIEAARQADPDTPAIIRFDQPWAEYMAREEMDLSPLHFADALLRAGLGLAGVGLEINVGFQPGDSMPRDRLDFHRLIDLWSCLGVPLFLFLTAPGRAAQATPVDATPSFAEGRSDEWTADRQRAFVESYLPLLLAKPAVHCITWNQFHDDPAGQGPNCGLWNARGKAKPALAALGELRRAHLA